MPKLLVISDTHGLHRKLKNLPPADIIVHAGDVSLTGSDHEVEDFIKWLGQLDYRHKIFIAGNHDFYFQHETIKRVQSMLLEDVHYLCDSGVEIEGLTFWGSPVTPRFFDLAFNRDRGGDIRKHWNKIPKDTDVLITHGAPYGILDMTKAGIDTGCHDLLRTVMRIKPRYHFFGHIHEAYGIQQTTHTTFVNGSILDDNFEIRNSPIILE